MELEESVAEADAVYLPYPEYGVRHAASDYLVLRQHLAVAVPVRRQQC